MDSTKLVSGYFERQNFRRKNGVWRRAMSSSPFFIFLKKIGREI